MPQAMVGDSVKITTARKVKEGHVLDSAVSGLKVKAGIRATPVAHENVELIPAAARLSVRNCGRSASNFNPGDSVEVIEIYDERLQQGPWLGVVKSVDTATDTVQVAWLYGGFCRKDIFSPCQIQPTSEQIQDCSAPNDA